MSDQPFTDERVRTIFDRLSACGATVDVLMSMNRLERQFAMFITGVPDITETEWAQVVALFREGHE